MTAAGRSLDLRDARAVLFDLDGVLTPTASLHRHAWRELFEEYFAAAHLSPPYSEDDYFAHLDGRPRDEGVDAVLASRGVRLPHGSPDDPAGVASVCSLGNQKNELFLHVLARDGIAAYPGSQALLDRLDGLGVPYAVVSSSRNAVEVLTAAGLVARPRAIVDGLVAERLRLAGKPEPDTFLAAAARLAVAPEAAAVVEDAASGILAGAAGGFGLLVGVDRGAGRQALKSAGAHVIVDDLAELLDGGDAARAP